VRVAAETVTKLACARWLTKLQSDSAVLTRALYLTSSSEIKFSKHSTWSTRRMKVKSPAPRIHSPTNHMRWCAKQAKLSPSPSPSTPRVTFKRRRERRRAPTSCRESAMAQPQVQVCRRTSLVTLSLLYTKQQRLGLHATLCAFLQPAAATDSIVLEEEIDPSYEPTEDEVRLVIPSDGLGACAQ
jgi:hypothetical protein